MRAGFLLVLLLTQQESELHASVRLAHRLNDIDSVICDSSKVVFMSRDGAIIHAMRDSSWSFDFDQRFTGSSTSLTQYHELRDPPLDRWLYEEGLLKVFKSYVSAVRSVTRDSALMILTKGSGEEAVWGTHCILDTSQSKTFCFPLDKTKALDFDQHAIWLGRFDGLARITRDDGHRSDFVVLPTITESSSALIGPDYLWIAADGIGIQRIELKTRKVKLWRAEDILADLQERHENNPHLSPKGRVVFSNFAATRDRILTTQDRIYIACHFVSGSNMLIRNSSFLFTFQPHIEEWDAQWLFTDGVPMNGASIIKIHGQRLVIGGTHQDLWEGGGHEEFGGIFYSFLTGKSIDEVRDVDMRHLVTSMRETETGDLLIETFEPSDIGRKRTYRIGSQYRITVVSDSVEAFYYEEFLRAKSSGNPRGPQALPDSILALTVAPEAWPLTQSHVEVTTH